MLKPLFRIIILAVIILAIVSIAAPSLLPSKIQPFASSLNHQLKNKIESSDQSLANLLKPETLDQIGGGLILGSQDKPVAVEDTFSHLSQQLQSLPANQAWRIKQEFCADVVEAALTASTSATP